MTHTEPAQQTSTSIIEQALQQAIARHQAGQLIDAEDIYLSILQVEPRHPDANYNLGLMAMQVNKAEKGLPYLQAAWEADPSIGQYWLTLTECLLEIGHFEDALLLIRDAIKREIKSPQALQLLMRAKNSHENKTRPAQSAKTDNLSKKTAPQQERHHPQTSPDHQEINMLADLFNKGQYTEAAALAEALTERFPLHVFGWKILGMVFKQMGRNEDALVPMQKAAALSPNDADAHSDLGVIFSDLGQLDKAEASYRLALQIKPDYAEAHNNLGVTLLALGRLDDAAESYRRALEIKPEKYLVENFIYLMDKLREFKAGAQFLCKLDADFPDNGYLIFAAGWLLASAGHFEEAEVLITKAAKLIPALCSKGDYSCSKSDLPIRLPQYRNHRAREMADEEWKYIELSDSCFSENASLLNKTRVVCFELSNICNYGTIHPRCPVHNYTSKEVLSAEIIKRVLDELGEIGFNGSIGWGCYTEPLIDPRLMDLVSYARKTCPRAKNVVTTNGFYLTLNSASDLVSAGIDQIIVSAYSMSEYLRFILLPIPASYCVYNSKLEKRTEDNVYNRAPLDIHARCFPFILNLMITCKGDLGLCCFDFDRRHSFGSLHTATLQTLLSSRAVIETHRRLASADRSILDACRRCHNGFQCHPYWLMA